MAIGYSLLGAGARSLLAAASKIDPVAVTVTVTNSPQMVRIAQVLQAQAGAAGFKVTVNQIDATSLITVLRSHDFDLCMSPWSGRYDPDGNVYNYFAKTGPNNFAGWQDDMTTAMLNEARSEPSQAKRVVLYKRIRARIIAEAPMLFLHFDAILQASSARLRWTQYPDAVFRLYDARLE